MCSNRPWFSQARYWGPVAVIFVALFGVGIFGAIPLITVALALVALKLQGNRNLSIIHEKKPPELIFYTMWAIWSFFAAIFIDIEDPYDFSSGMRTLVRMVILLWSAYACFAHQARLDIFWKAILFVTCLQVVASYMGYSIDIIQGTNLRSGIVRIDDGVDLESNSRAEGLTGNANAMGFAMLAGVWVSLMLWKLKRGRFSVLHKSFLIVLMLVFSYFTIATASRKSLLSLAIMLGAWLVWMIPGRFSIKSFFVSCFFTVLILLVAVPFVGGLMEDSFAMKRFLELFDVGGGSASEGFKKNVRYWLYVDGLNFFKNNPIFGIGFGQFSAHHWSGLYSHSDYMEPLACTGLIGFILYHGFAFSVTCRVIKLLRGVRHPVILYLLKGMLLYMIFCHYVVGFGAPFWPMVDHNLIVLSIGVFTWQIKRRFIDRVLYYTS